MSTHVSSLHKFPFSESELEAKVYFPPPFQNLLGLWLYQRMSITLLACGQGRRRSESELAKECETESETELHLPPLNPNLVPREREREDHPQGRYDPGTPTPNPSDHEVEPPVMGRIMN